MDDMCKELSIRKTLFRSQLKGNGTYRFFVEVTDDDGEETVAEYVAMLSS